RMAAASSSADIVSGSGTTELYRNSAGDETPTMAARPGSRRGRDPSRGSRFALNYIYICPMPKFMSLRFLDRTRRDPCGARRAAARWLDDLPIWRPPQPLGNEFIAGIPPTRTPIPSRSSLSHYQRLTKCEPCTDMNQRIVKSA